MFKLCKFKRAMVALLKREGQIMSAIEDLSAKVDQVLVEVAALKNAPPVPDPQVAVKQAEIDQLNAQITDLTLKLTNAGL